MFCPECEKKIPRIEREPEPTGRDGHFKETGECPEHGRVTRWCPHS